MAMNDAELRFRATLEDDTTPQLDKLQKKMEAMGASPQEIRMNLRAYDQASPQIDAVRKQLRDMPKQEMINIRASSDAAREHMRALRHEFAEPLEVPIHFTDNLEQVGQRLFTMKTRLAGPIGGLIPGSSMLYGVGMGAGVLGAVSGMTEYLKKSIDVNSELEQQHAQLTQAMKDSGQATQEMTRLMKMSTSSQFGRSDLTQADIISRQFNLPSFRGESKYLPSGVIPISQNLAAAGQTTVAQAADAIARATQGYFRGLLPYGISLRQEDFGTGGRFAGKSTEQAIEELSRRYAGAADQQAKTFQGTIDKFKNVFEERFITPLGAMAFNSFKGTMGGALSGLDSPSAQNRIAEFMAKLQDGLAKAMNLIRQGKTYFDANLKQPIEDLIKSVVKFGETFAKYFGGTFITIVSTLGQAFLSIAKPIAAIVAAHPQIAETYGILKALSVIGFGNISSGLVAPLKDLSTGHPFKFVSDLMKLPGIFAKIGTALVIKGFLDAHVATQALNNEFPKMKDHMADVNWQIDKMADKLGQSTTAMKKLVAETGNILKGDPNGQADQLRLSMRTAQAGGQLNQALGVDATQAGEMIARAVAASKDYSMRNVSDLEDGLGKAATTARALGYSFTALQRIISMYAADAGKAGLGGIGMGAATLVGLQRGADMLPGNPNERVSQLLRTYGDPSAAQLRGINLGRTFSFGSNPAAVNSYIQNQTISGGIIDQSHTADRSNREMLALLHRIAPTARVPAIPNPLAANLPNLQGISPGYGNAAYQRMEGTPNPLAQAESARAQLEQTAKAIHDANDEIQKLQVSMSTLDNRNQEFAMAQQSVNMQMEAFQHSMVKDQRGIEDIQLAMSTLQLNAIRPLERQMTQLNETMARNSHTQSEAQYQLSKYTQGLLEGEQAALDHTHALQRMNQEIQLMQLSYQQIGAELGTTQYDQGMRLRVNPLAQITLADQAQRLQRKSQINDATYGLTYGEQHYQLDQAARSKYQREEISFANRMREITKNTPIVDQTTEAAHKLGNEQFALSEKMYPLTEKVADQQDQMSKLSLTMQRMNDSHYFRNLQDEQYHLQRQTERTSLAQQKLQVKLGVYQNIFETLKGKGDDLHKLFASLRDDTSDPSKFNIGQHVLQFNHQVGGLNTQQYNTMKRQLDKAEATYREAHSADWQKRPKDWVDIIKRGVAGIFTGSTERQVVDAFHHGLQHPPHLPFGLQHVIDPFRSVLGSGALGTAAAIGATGYIGISTARAALGAGRYGLLRGGGRALQHLLPETHVADRVDNLRRGFDNFREDHFGKIAKSLKVLEESAPGTPEYEKAQITVRRAELREEKFAENAGKPDLVRAADRRAGELREAITGPFRWFRNFHEKAIHAVVSTALVAAAGAIHPGLIPAALYASRRISKNRAERMTIRDELRGGGSIARDTVDIARDVKNGLQHPIDTIKNAASDEVKAAKDNIKAATKQHGASDTAHGAAKDTAAAVKDNKGAISRFAARVRAFGEHIKEHGGKIAIFSGAVTAFAAAVGIFGKVFDGIKDFLHIDSKPKVPRAPKVTRGEGRIVGPNEGGHPTEVPWNHTVDAHGRVHDERGRYTGQRAEVPKTGIFSRLFHHGNNLFMGGQNVLGALSGNVGSEAYIGGSAINQLIRGARQRMVHGGLSPALREAAAAGTDKSVAELSAKDIGKFLAKRIGLTGLGVAGGVLTAPLDLYYGGQMLNMLMGNPGGNYKAPQTPTQMGLMRTALRPSQNQLAQYVSQNPPQNGMAGNLSPDEAQLLVHNQMVREKLAETLTDKRSNLTPEQYKEGWRKLQVLQDQYNRMFQTATKSSNDDTQKMEQDAQDLITKTRQDAHTQRLRDLTTYNTDQTQTTDKGLKDVYGVTDSWLKKLHTRINQGRTSLGLAATGLHNSANQSSTSQQNSSQVASMHGWAHGGFPTQHIIKGKKDGKGHLIRVGEEDDELIIPMAPHRRERAKSLLKHAAGLIPGFANGGHANKGTVMMIHGGGWVNGDPKMYQAQLAKLRKAGYKAVSIDYPLGDISDAFASVKKQAMKLAKRNGPLIAMGQSAGASMASWLAAKGIVDGAVADAAPYDLARFGRDVRVPGYVMPHESAKTLKNLSAIDQWNKHSTKLYMMASKDDTIVDYGQSQAMAAKTGRVIHQLKGNHVQDPRWFQKGLNWIKRSFAQGGYVNPFSAANYVPNRVDMGVDYTGMGPVRAIGDATVLHSENAPGWDHGAWIDYRLRSGPNRGKVVFVAEGIRNMVRAGSQVKAGQRIADMYRNIETGWGSGADQQALAAALGQQNHNGDPGEFPTASGVSFNNFLAFLGAKPGIVAGHYRGSMKDLKGFHAAGGGGGIGGGLTIPLPQALKTMGTVGILAYDALRKLKKDYNHPGHHAHASSLGGFHGGGNEAANIALGQRMARAVGWVGKQWLALKNLWMGESGWNASIMHNPSMGWLAAGNASGIPQADGHGQVYKRGDAASQIRWGINYIKGSYGDPANAYGKWLSRSPHWYATGKHRIENDQELAVLHRGERVLNPAQASAHDYVALGNKAFTGDQKRLSNHIEDIADKVTKLLHKITSIDDKTEKKKDTKDLHSLNEQLRTSFGRLNSSANLHSAIGQSAKMRGDTSGGEGTTALVDHEKRTLRNRVRTAVAHAKRSKKYKTAVSRAQKAHKAVTSAMRRAHKVHSPGGRKVTKAERGHINTLRHRAHTADHNVSSIVKNARATAKKGYAKDAKNKRGVNPAIIKMVSGINATIKAQTKAHGKATSEATKKRVDAAKATTRAIHDHHTTTKKADDHEVKAQAASYKRQDAFEKKALTHLEAISRKDLTVTVNNKASGATITTTVVKKRAS